MGQGAPSRSAGLLTLVRNLIAVGKALIDSALRQGDAAPSELSLRFGTFNISLIIARITRGLRIAEALQARLIRNAERLDNPPARATRRTDDAKPKEKRQPRPAPPPLSQQDDDAALLARLPTAQAIANKVRRRPIGLVIDDICRDLGIDCSHPLWGDIQKAIIFNGGNLLRHVIGMFERLRSRTPRDTRPLPSAQASAALTPQTGTGPP